MDPIVSKSECVQDCYYHHQRFVTHFPFYTISNLSSASRPCDYSHFHLLLSSRVIGKKSLSLSTLQVSDFYLLIYEVSRFHGTTSFSHLMNELTPQKLCACVFHVPLEATNCADTRQRQMKNDHLPSYTKISPPEGTITQSDQLQQLSAKSLELTTKFVFVQTKFLKKTQQTTERKQKK